MVSWLKWIFDGSGLHALTRFFFAIALLCAAEASFAQAGAQNSARATVPPQPPLDLVVATKLVWSTMAALDHANQTGNYSVLRDMGAPSFQANNSAATLGGIFESIRNQRIDLSNTILVEPTYDLGPAIIEGGLLRAKGAFRLRPTAIAFDLIFQNVAGQWRLLGISVAPIAIR